MTLSDKPYESRLPTSLSSPPPPRHQHNNPTQPINQPKNKKMTDPERPPSPKTVAAREEAEKQRKATEAAEQAQLPYSWTQSIGDVDVSVPVDGKLRGRDMDVYLGREGIRVGVKGESPILEVYLPLRIYLSCLQGE